MGFSSSMSQSLLSQLLLIITIILLQGKLIQSAHHHTNVAYCVRIDPYCQTSAVSCSRDGVVNMYDLRDSCNLVQKFTHVDSAKKASPVYCVDVCNMYVASGTKNGELNIWDLRYSKNSIQTISLGDSVNRITIDEAKCVVSSGSELYFYEIDHCHTKDKLNQDASDVLKLINRQAVHLLSPFSLAMGSSVSFDTDMILSGDEKGNICLMTTKKKKNKKKRSTKK
jgi:WD40 repeat protein